MRGVRFKSKRGVRCILKPRADSGLTNSSLFSPGCARTCKKHLTPRFADLNLTPRTALALKVHEPYIRHEMRSPFTPEPFSFQGSGLSEWGYPPYLEKKSLQKIIEK